jgi:arylsulfatase A-like enzyme
MTNRTYTRRGFLRSAGLAITGALAGCASGSKHDVDRDRRRKPNFIIFLTDDQGYNDVGCFGSPQIKTPNFDRMAREGMLLSSYYVGSPVCGPSRAALMTGSYPIRVAEPQNKKNLHTKPHTREIMLPEVLKQAGYATGLIGKWHLAGGLKKDGRYPSHLMPYGQGFDTFYGTPLHNGTTATVTPKAFQVQVMRNDEVLVDRLDQEGMDNLTADYTREAIQFIAQHRNDPFFLYLAHNMPHVPLGASKAFRGKSTGGLYGDVIEELDWSIGRVLDKLKELDLDDDTFVIFTSDNGPWIEAYLKGYYGSAGPLRGSKMKSWEGGPRVPCIMRWPGNIPAGRICDEIATTMDIFPTFAGLAGASLPQDRTIDGKDIFPLISGRTRKSPHDEYFFYCYTHLHGVRSGRWKLVLPRPARPQWMSWWARMIDEVKDLQLFDLKTDIGETTNMAGEHPEIVKRLMESIEYAREELGDCDRLGSGARFFDPGPKRPDIKKYQAWRGKQA